MLKSQNFYTKSHLGTTLIQFNNTSFNFFLNHETMLHNYGANLCFFKHWLKHNLHKWPVLLGRTYRHIWLKMEAPNSIKNTLKKKSFNYFLSRML